MSCDELEVLLPDYWRQALAPAERARLEAHLAECAACRDEAQALGHLWQRLGVLEAEEQPSPRVQGRFDALLAAWHEDAAARGSRGTERDDRRAWRPWRRPAFQAAAAALLLVTGFGAGRLVPDRRATSEMAELKTEVRMMREMVTLSLLQQQSAAERLRGVTWSHQIDRPGEAVLAALIDTLRRDQNVNVRLAAIEALRQFGRDETVRGALIASVSDQESPLVQVELVDLLVEWRDERSRAVLRALADDERANQVVRERARWGLSQGG